MSRAGEPPVRVLPSRPAVPRSATCREAPNATANWSSATTTITGTTLRPRSPLGHLFSPQRRSTQRSESRGHRGSRSSHATPAATQQPRDGVRAPPESRARLPGGSGRAADCAQGSGTGRPCEVPHLPEADTAPSRPAELALHRPLAGEHYLPQHQTPMYPENKHLQRLLGGAPPAPAPCLCVTHT